jgi:hypothetical protein
LTGAELNFIVTGTLTLKKYKLGYKRPCLTVGTMGERIPKGIAQPKFAMQLPKRGWRWFLYLLMEISCLATIKHPSKSELASTKKTTKIKRTVELSRPE